MAKRSARDFAATMEQQMKQFKPIRVNPFPMMMDAARHNQAQQACRPTGPGTSAAVNNTGSATATATNQAAVPCTMCSHCGVGLSELQVQQCHACKSVYCSSCSVINYDEREDRIFCLDCNTDSMQLSSGEEETDFPCSAENNVDSMHHYQQHQLQHNVQYTQQDKQQYNQQQQYMCSPPARHMLGGCHGAAQQALSAERRSSVLRACNMAAAAAAAATDSGGSCMAAMAGISGLRKEQMTPLFAQGGLCGAFGGSSAGRAQGASVLGQWDLNSPPLARIAMGQRALATPAVLNFNDGY